MTRGGSFGLLQTTSPTTGADPGECSVEDLPSAARLPFHRRGPSYRDRIPARQEEPLNRTHPNCRCRSGARSQTTDPRSATHLLHCRSETVRRNLNPCHRSRRPLVIRDVDHGRVASGFVHEVAVVAAEVIARWPFLHIGD